MLTDPDGLNALTSAIIGCAIRVHQTTGPGLLESVYSECMQYELRDSALNVEVGRRVPLVYRGHQLRARYYTDLVVESLVAVELKCVVEIAEIHKRQLFTQLKLAGLPVGLLMNFNVVVLTSGGIRRVINPSPHDRESGGPPAVR